MIGDARRRPERPSINTFEVISGGEKYRMRVLANRLIGLRLLSLFVVLSILVPTFPARAHEEGQGEQPGPICELNSIMLAEGAPEELDASCGVYGLLLGPISEFAAIPNENLKAMLVDIRFQGDRRILLLSLSEDGLPILQNITGQIARTAGKGTMSDINDVTIDLVDFASAGTVAVEKVGDFESEANAEIAEISLGEQLQTRQSSANGAVQ